MGPVFRLTMRSGPTPGKNFPLEKNDVYIGRDLSNDLVINDPEVSRRHSRLFFQNTTYILEDLGSTNGTSVNGQRLISPYILNPGDLITLGERITLFYEAVAPAGDSTVVSLDSQQERTAQAAAPFTPAAYPPAYGPSAYEPSPAGQARPAAIPAKAPQSPIPLAPPAYPATPAAPVPQYQTVQPAYPKAQTPAPSFQPPPPAQPVYAQVPPAQPSGYDQPAAFSGQVPYLPGTEPEAPARAPIWPYIVIGVLLLIILVLVIDDFHLWCPLFGMCG